MPFYHYQINLEIVFDKYSIHSEELFNAHWIQLVPIKIHGETNIDNEVKRNRTPICVLYVEHLLFFTKIFCGLFSNKPKLLTPIDPKSQFRLGLK